MSRDFGIVRGTSNYCDNHPEHRIVPPNMVSNYSHGESFSRAVVEIGGLRFTEDGVLSGDAVLIKRSVVERIGALDLRFFGYFGDIDYGLRARLANFKLVCAKGAWLYHEGAGHIKADAKKQKMDLNSSHQRRMRLVEEAYQVFRQKWDMRPPPTYAQLDPRHLFEMAEKNARRVDLKYELPSSIRGEFRVC